MFLHQQFCNYHRGSNSLSVCRLVAFRHSWYFGFSILRLDASYPSSFPINMLHASFPGYVILCTRRLIVSLRLAFDTSCARTCYKNQIEYIHFISEDSGPYSAFSELPVSDESTLSDDPQIIAHKCNVIQRRSKNKSCNLVIWYHEDQPRFSKPSFASNSHIRSSSQPTFTEKFLYTFALPLPGVLLISSHLGIHHRSTASYRNRCALGLLRRSAQDAWHLLHPPIADLPFPLIFWLRLLNITLWLY